MYRDLHVAVVDDAVVMAGDAQTDPQYLPALLDPIAAGEAGFPAANRFDDVASLEGMPRHRIFGNVVLSFLTKAASGHRSASDPLGYLLLGLAVCVFVVVNTVGPDVASPGTVLLAVAPVLSGLHVLISALMVDIEEANR